MSALSSLLSWIKSHVFLDAAGVEITLEVPRLILHEVTLGLERCHNWKKKQTKNDLEKPFNPQCHIRDR